MLPQDLVALSARGPGRALWFWVFGVLMLLLLALGSFTTLRLRNIFENVRAEVQIAEPRVVAARQIEIDVFGYVLNVRAFLGGFAEGQRLAAENAKDLVRDVAEYRRLVETPRQQELADRLDSQWMELYTHAEALMAAGRAAPEDLTRLATLSLKMERLLEDVLPDALAFQRARTIATLSDLEQTNRVALLQFSGGLIMVLFASAVVVWIALAGQAALHQSEERYRIVADFNNDWEFWIGPHGRYEYVSPSVQRLTGRNVSSGTDAGDFLRLIAHPEDLEHLLELLREALDQQTSGEHEYRVLHPDGQVRWIHHVFQPVHDQTGRFLGTRGSIRDVTDRKEAEVQLALSLSELREAQQELMRRERLATLEQLAGTVAHHIRTPLTVISNSVFFLEHSPQPPAQAMREVLSETKRAVANSDEIITAMLDFVRERGARFTSFPLGEAVSSALKMVPLPETVRHRSLAAEAAGLKVRADKDLLVHTLVNLIRNAVEAMSQGGELEIAANREEGGLVELTVGDTGCGIPEENLDKIFDPLFSTKISGLGMGLAIARRYTQINGGSLTVESTVGRGTSFRLVIPAQA